MDRRLALARTSTGGGAGTDWGRGLLTEYKLRRWCHIQKHPRGSVRRAGWRMMRAEA